MNVRFYEMLSRKFQDLAITEKIHRRSAICCVIYTKPNKYQISHNLTEMKYD